MEQADQDALGPCSLEAAVLDVSPPLFAEALGMAKSAEILDAVVGADTAQGEITLRTVYRLLHRAG